MGWSGDGKRNILWEWPNKVIEISVAWIEQFVFKNKQQRQI